MLRFALVFLAAVALVACSKEPEQDHATEDHSSHHQAHDPVYGGTLIELGEHEAQAELVFDAGTGLVTLYLWDGHVSKPARCKQLSIAIDVDSGDEPVALELEPVANPLTGETFGDTSKFETRSDKLKGRANLAGWLGGIHVLGSKFERVRFIAGAQAK